MFTKLKIRLLSYGYRTDMLRLSYSKGSIWYRKRSGNGAGTERSNGTDGDKGERRYSGKLITRVDKITDIGEKVRAKFANTEKFL